MDINPSYVTIGKLFEQNFLFEIPKYQRYYAWDDEQVDDYIKDISVLIHDPSRDHFFGGIVCVEKIIPGSNRQQRVLVDGQQRITTTMLLVAAIYHKYTELLKTTRKKDLKNIIESRMEKISRKYFFYDDEINRIPQKIPHLAVSEADKSCYDSIISKGIPSINERESHKKMGKAFEKLKTFIENEGLKKKDILSVLESAENAIDKGCNVIFIDTKTKKDAYVLFQVLNDRGMGLTVGDLLKSKTLEMINSDGSRDEETLLVQWDCILSGESKSIDRFLRYYYMSVKGCRAGATSLYDDYLRDIFAVDENKDAYNQKEKKSILSAVNALYEACDNYKKIELGDWPYESKQPITLWERNRLKNLVGYLDYDITLALLISATKLDQKKYYDLVYTLEKFMFRYKRICNNKHQKLREIFMKESVLIRNNSSSYRVGNLKKQLRVLLEQNAGDEVFKEKLKALKYVKGGTNKMIKYLLATLNEHYDWYVTNKTSKPKPQTGSVINFENVSIEHIYSQNPSSDTEPIEGIDVDELKNLTILTLNENSDEVKNKQYSMKRQIYMKSDYTINKAFEKYEKWNEESMDAWLNMILDMSCKVFVI